MIEEKILKRVLKPGRYTGGEFGQIIKDKAKVKARFAFCFPDTYEIGMSNLGIRILYGALNAHEDIWCERAYAPWIDMEEEMRKGDIPLWAVESGDPLKEFDIVGFTLQYELCYTNVLNVLELAKIPLLASERTDSDPIIIGGGPCSYNPEPVADFFDLFSIGEGEEALCEITRLYIQMKEEGSYTRAAFLREAARMDGFYVPSLYEVRYNEDGTIASHEPKYEDVPRRVVKRIMKDMDESYFPENFVMPYIETVHDRIMLEVYRGCIRGCRFCQAGMVYRPIREKTPDRLNEQAKCLFRNTGYDEISLSSLSISDYTQIGCLTDKLLEWTDDSMVSLSLPSMRLDSFTHELMEKISGVRSSTLTFAPEAGTQRLRDAINKNVTEADLLQALDVAFDYGKNTVKLYFMLGLPTETDEDIEGIAQLAKRVIDYYYERPGKRKGKAPSVTISVACFIPKPDTAFQWEAQCTLEELDRKQQLLKEKITDRRIRYNYHDANVSRLEAVFARGDRKLSGALLEARRRGVRFDSWDEFFNYDIWMEIFDTVGIDPAFYANRTFGEDEVLPWDVIDCGVDKAFFKRERAQAYASIPTPNCKEKCSGCGANRLGGERSWCRDCPSSLAK
ncbi:MAG: TIGR03960 family B12-binding radical SAM protein [Clostridia bacterium]|nr:TIGR03960 family B12-binding radical SAM protein [Clostridia bacterium]